MNDITKIELPFYAKATIVLFGLMLLMFGIWVSADIVTPFAFATLLAILLNPINLFFQRRRIPTLISIILTVLCGALILAGIFYFMATQISDFADAAPKLKARLQDLLQQGQHWLSSSYNISAKKQVEYLNKMGDNAGTYIGTA
ncbi:MAG TPA: AI-2E family transporter, partial [Cytophagales bacterium]|nr:AI-2E family transporter [Cytophagales bacterium]